MFKFELNKHYKIRTALKVNTEIFECIFVVPETGTALLMRINEHGDYVERLADPNGAWIEHIPPISGQFWWVIVYDELDSKSHTLAFDKYNDYDDFVRHISTNRRILDEGTVKWEETERRRG